MPLSPVPGRQKQADLSELAATLTYRARAARAIPRNPLKKKKKLTHKGTGSRIKI